MELGSEFSLEKRECPCEDSIFHYLSKYQTIYTDSGRSALRLLLPLLPSGPVLLPAYICESVYRLFRDRECIFYEYTDELGIDWKDLHQKLNDRISVLYLHYFNGRLPERSLLKQLEDRKKEQGFFIIEDTTHSIFSSPLTVGDYGICSLRKWFPAPDGGVLYCENSERIGIGGLVDVAWSGTKAKAMALKAEYLAGRRGEACNLEYRRMFAFCDKALDEQRGAFRMSDFSVNILRTCSVSELMKARRENWKFLAGQLKEIPDAVPIASPGPADCPLVCSIRLKDRDPVRGYLISQKIYCAVHWPEAEMPTDRGARIAGQELSLPIDQRYGAVELSYLLDRMRRYRGVETSVEIGQQF